MKKNVSVVLVGLFCFLSFKGNEVHASEVINGEYVKQYSVKERANKKIKVQNMYFEQMDGIPTIDYINGQKILEDELGNDLPIANLNTEDINFSVPGVYITTQFYSTGELQEEIQVPVVVTPKMRPEIKQPLYLEQNDQMIDLAGTSQKVLADELGNALPIDGLDTESIDRTTPGVYKAMAYFSYRDPFTGYFKTGSIEIPVIVEKEQTNKKIKVNNIYFEQMDGIPTIDYINGQKILEDECGNVLSIAYLNTEEINFSVPGVYITTQCYSTGEAQEEIQVPVVVTPKMRPEIKQPLYLKQNDQTIDLVGTSQKVLVDESGNAVPIDKLDKESINLTTPGVYKAVAHFGYRDQFTGYFKTGSIEIPVVVEE